jgi:hypothetical protein
VGSEKITVDLKNTEPVTRSVEISFQALNARFVKIFAKNIGVCPPGHKWAGRKAWLFVDEVMVE